LVSTLRRTVILRIGPDESVCQVESISKSFRTELPTLALCNIPRRSRNQGVSSYSDSPLVVQITPKALLLLEFDMSVGEYTQTDEIWTPDKLQNTSSMNFAGTGREIVAAGVNPSQFVLGLSGRSLVLMNLTENGKFQIMRQVLCCFLYLMRLNGLQPSKSDARDP
jgi:DNA damage-binding protein 1